MAQKQTKPTTRKEHVEESDDAVASASPVENEELAANIEDILDEIDDVLEENAEEFVRSYVQKGGQ